MMILIEIAKILATLILCIILFGIFFICGTMVLYMIALIIKGLINGDE